MLVFTGLPKALWRQFWFNNLAALSRSRLTLALTEKYEFISELGVLRASQLANRGIEPLRLACGLDHESIVKFTTIGYPSIADADADADASA